MAGHARTWFDNTTSVTAPWTSDSAGNSNSTVRIAKAGASVGNFLPVYSGVGGNYTPTSTFEVYNSMASAIGPTAFVSSGGTLVLTSGGTSNYTGSSALTYCVQINSAANPNTYKWDSANCATLANSGTVACATPQALGSNGATITWSGGNCSTTPTGGVSGDTWTFTLSPGGTTNELIQAGVGQTGSIWQVSNNAGNPLWFISAGGNLFSTSGFLGLTGAGGGTADISAPPTTFTNYTFNLPSTAGTAGQFLASAGSASPQTWTTLGGIAALTAAVGPWSTVETQVIGTALLPAGALQAGTTFRIYAFGTITSTVASTVTFNLRIGATTGTGLIPSAIGPTSTTGSSSAPFMFEGYITIRSAGTSGTMYGSAKVLGNPGGGTTAFSVSTGVAAGTQQTINTATQELVELTVVTGSASTAVTFQEAQIEVVKP